MRYCERMRVRYFPETLTALAPMFPADAGAVGAHAGRGPVPVAG